jgi:type VI secretion system secreted protein VgrG
MTDILSPELAELIARLGSGLSQHARLLTLTQAYADQRPDNFVVERIIGSEGINTPYHFEVDVLSVSTDLALDPLLGEPYTLRLLQADGSYRAWHGYCTEASWLGTDGGVARYQLRLESFLAFLHLRYDSYIFKNKNTLDIVTELFADYPQSRIRFDVSRTLPVRDITTQYRESDLDFLTRILARDGLSYRFEHDQTPPDDSNPTLQAYHTLVIFDAQAAVPDMPGGRSLRFAGVRASDTDDAIDHFAASSQVVSHQVAVSSWLANAVIAPAAEAGRDAPAALPSLAQYIDTGAAQFADAAAADSWASDQLLAIAFDEAQIHGRGAVRHLTPGYGFDLTGHDDLANDGNRFTVVSVRHEAVNNLGAGFNHNASLHDAEHGTYRNRFTAIPAATAIMPSADARLPRATARGAQTALVVGLPEAVTTSTRDHQLRIQFHWQRGASPNPGGLMDTGNSVDTTGHAPGNEQSGTWVRVAEALAGANWGSSFTPRIGTEVLVDFINNDIDQPVIVASLYNGVDTPPFAAGVDGGLDHAGVISGWHSQNFSGDGYNQWLVDDAASELQMQLMSSTANTALNLGWLRSRAPASALRGAARGLGLEARTDAWGQLRGNAGVWLTTAERSQSGTSVTSTQLDASEAADQLAAADSLNKTLRDAAVAQSAQVSDVALKAVPDLQLKLQPKADTAAAQALRFDAAIAGLDSDASLNAATGQSMLLFAQQHLTWTTQGDSHWAAQHTVSMNSGDATTLFTHDGGMMAIAANAPVSLAAHTDALEILADQSVNVTSTHNAILVEAQQKIVLQAGQSAIVLDGGNITFTCPGKFSVKGASHPFGGGGSDSAMLNALPNTTATLPDDLNYGIELDVGSFFQNDPQLQDASYEVWSQDSTPELLGSGSIDSIGRSDLAMSSITRPVDIFVGENEWVDVMDIQTDNDAMGEDAT